MSNALAWIVATFVTLPLLAFYFVYIVSVKTTKNKRRSIKLAVDVTTILFIFAVYYIAYELWALSLFWLILIAILIVAIIFTIIHWKLSKDIELKKLIKGIWRLNFLLFLIVYFLLSIYGLFSRIFMIT
ncbi:hypothetical protein BKP45_19400 [Anaerobacillus alkalidiazotrophicus]|uniref:DUF3397 domain-containing protein n=1 Tax=Anaerobacillus alkalidiazotrophicus TaxID=472963 RepID=A0A1S2LZG7_9BACI|nr:DUF3397 domain-containing protein [Anaerobacillus alkalidiazotrophicus]OIJ17736.1 hypothetical protein BKP45_19400 [Anaerobacillus alkalidiazotrophicus]